MFQPSVSRGRRACRVLRVQAQAPLGRSSTNHWHTFSPSHFYSSTTSKSTSNRNSKKYTTAITAGLLSSTSLLWWLVGTSGPSQSQSQEGEVPHLNTQIPSGQCKSGLSEEDVTAILSKNAYSYRVHDISGVDRYDGAQVASNSPCEDTFVHGSFPPPLPLASTDGNRDESQSQSQWMAWAVFDGHLGRQTADVLQRELIGYVSRRINALQPSEITDDGAIQRAIVQGFTDLDEAIFATAMSAAADTDIETEESLASKVQKMMPAFAGSCALLTLFDPRTRTLHVACTGDSRAVLAQQNRDNNGSGSWRTTQLSTDQTGSNESEIARVNAEHPGESGIVRGGRVLGLMVSRAFGDGQWKWPVEIQKDLKERFHGPGLLNPRYEVRTPPYITAEPVVTSTRVEDGNAAFVVLGTDGLWDFMGSHQAVELVGRWIDAHAHAHGQKAVDKGSLEPGSDFGVRGGQFDFGRLGKKTSEPWGFAEGRTTVQDSNSAVHLIRNAFGGAHRELISARLAFEAPHSRRVRDDTTVQVVFFNMKDLVERGDRGRGE
ncbi:pyruvate dehydrogenase [Aspergillus ustus]|uniref:Pyruvate dehydrogenase n=1 Tax=Aspergillus ustus TaxID=40382 RepID=A0A0C1EFR7_ASPUT|nr:pyruvate dehydrogenase [Aspergillus ustus]